MKIKAYIWKVFVSMILAFGVAVMPICANKTSYSSVMPRFNNISNAMIGLGFDMDNMVYCSISIEPYSNCTGISGIMKLFDSNGTCLAVWSVSDYERPIGAEFSHQGVYRETYTATFEGYAYSNNGTQPDRLELSTTDTCK